MTISENGTLPEQKPRLEHSENKMLSNNIINGNKTSSSPKTKSRKNAIGIGPNDLIPKHQPSPKMAKHSLAVPIPIPEHHELKRGGSTSGNTSSGDEDDENGDNVLNMNGNTDILPWNIVEDPPWGTNKKELYPMEGSWRLISNQNYDKYLSAIGVTPLMAQMVLRSDYMVTIYEDIDKCWKILTETAIKAKSIRGYRTRNYKMTSNKFMLDDAKPELLEDWDPRLVKKTYSTKLF